MVKKSLIIATILFAVSAWGSGMPVMLSETTTLLVIFSVLEGFGMVLLL